MSTLISDWIRQALRFAACFLMLAVLAGCGSGLGGGVAPAEVAVTADRIVVTGPAGYCVDPSSTRDQDDTGFVLLGNCAAIANSRRADEPATPAVLTAAVSEPSDGGQLVDSLGTLDGFFRSDEGLRLISRTGDAATVTVLDTAIEDNVFFLHVTDTSAESIDGAHSDYWRAYLDVGRRIATLSVIGLEEHALSRDESLSTLRDFVGAVLSANSGAPDSPITQTLPVTPEQAAPENVPQRGRPLFNVGLFRRILG